MKNFKKEKTFAWASVIFVMVSFLFVGSILAQTTNVVLEGMVTDDEGQALPGATINLRNVETGYIYSAIVQNDGRYIISGIVPGKHEIEVILQGFATQKRKGLTFNVGARLKIDFTLTQATVEEEVVVTAEVPMVEVSKSEISNVVDRKKIDDIPISLSDGTFEGWSYLSITTPGVQNDGSNQVANAAPRGSGEILLDGVSLERIATGRATAGVPADAIQEFRVITNQFQAEYGNASDLVRTAITRSGTNEFRGRVSYFFRNEAFNDVNYFVNHKTYQGEELPKDQWSKPDFEYHRFGGFLGGPIKKDKTHFMFVYDGMYWKSYSVITSPLVPRETVPYYEKPTRIMAKINHQFNEKNNLTLRYNLDRPVRLNAGVGGFNTMDRVNDYYRTVHDVFANWTLFPSDKSMNELKLHYSRQFDDIRIPDPDSYSITRPSGNLGKANNLPQGSTFRRWQIADNFNLYLAKHSLKFGFDYSTAPWYFFIYSNMPGTFTFLTDKPFNASDPTTYPYRFDYAVGEPGLDIGYKEFGLFAQDSWQITQQLTLNIGLRYNIYSTVGTKIDKWDIRNLNPRFGFSWDMFGDGKTSVRGGIGTYSSNIPGDAFTSVAFFGLKENRVIMFPNYPDPFASNPFYTPVPGSVTATRYDAKEGQIAPYTLQTSLGIERQVFTDLSIGADLVWTKGYRLPFYAQNNPVIPGTSVVREDPTLGDWYTLTDTGKSDYKGFLLSIRKRFSKGWGIDVAYTLSKSKSDTDYLGSPVNYEDPENKRMYGPTNMDARHVFCVSGIAELPFGFQLGGLFYYNTAFPWTPIYMTDVNKDGLVSDYVDEYRNSRRGFDNYFLNLRISKDINISRFRIQLIAEGYNITNSTNFSGIYTRYGSSRFGIPQSAGNPRQLQLGIRVDF